MTELTRKVAEALACEDEENEFGIHAWEAYVPWAKAAMSVALEASAQAAEKTLAHAWKDANEKYEAQGTGYWEGRCDGLDAASRVTPAAIRTLKAGA